MLVASLRPQRSFARIAQYQYGSCIQRGADEHVARVAGERSGTKLRWGNQVICIVGMHVLGVPTHALHNPLRHGKIRRRTNANKIYEHSMGYSAAEIPKWPSMYSLAVCRRAPG